MPRVTCDQCGSVFIRVKSKTQNVNNFCSQLCHRESRQKFVSIKCARCGVEFERRDTARVRAVKTHYCGKECSDKGLQSRHRYTKPHREIRVYGDRYESVFTEQRYMIRSMKGDWDGWKSIDTLMKEFHRLYGYAIHRSTVIERIKRAADLLGPTVTGNVKKSIRLTIEPNELQRLLMTWRRVPTTARPSYGYDARGR